MVVMVTWRQRDDGDDEEDGGEDGHDDGESEGSDDITVMVKKVMMRQ